MAKESEAKESTCKDVIVITAAIVFSAVFTACIFLALQKAVDYGLLKMPVNFIDQNYGFDPTMPVTEMPQTPSTSSVFPPTTPIMPSTTEPTLIPEKPTKTPIMNITIGFVQLPKDSHEILVQTLKIKIQTIFSELISNSSSLIFIGHDSECHAYGPFISEKDDVLQKIDIFSQTVELPNLNSTCIPKGGIMIGIFPPCEIYGRNAKLCFKTFAMIKRWYQFQINVMSTMEELNHIIENAKELLD